MTTVVLNHIQDIKPGIPPWIIKVVLHDIANPRQSYSSPKRYQRLVFADESGQKVMATLYDKDISKFENMFELFETYKIANARVSPLDIKYNKYNYPYQWTITTRTAISHEVSEVIPRSSIKLNFASIAHLKVDTENDELIDVMVLVIEKRPIRSVVASGKQHVVRDFTVINQDKLPIILTLWNSVAESEGKLIDEAQEDMPVIRATRLSVSSFYGLSLASTPATAIIVDPNIAEAQNLKTWRVSNQKLISDALAKKEYLIHDDSFQATTEKEIYSLTDVVTAKKVDKFVVRVKAKITNNDQKFFYMACNFCFSGVDAELNHAYKCASCKENALAYPRQKLSLNIYDDSGELDVTVFGDLAAKILQINAFMSMEMYNAGDDTNVEKLNTEMSEEIFLMKLKKKENLMRNALQIQYVVIALQLEKELIKQPTETISTAKSNYLNESATHSTTSVARQLFAEEGVDKSTGAKDDCGTFASQTI